MLIAHTFEVSLNCIAIIKENVKLLNMPRNKISLKKTQENGEYTKKENQFKYAIYVKQYFITTNFVRTLST